MEGYKPLQDRPISDVAKATELVSCLDRLLPAVSSMLQRESGGRGETGPYFILFFFVCFPAGQSSLFAPSSSWSFRYFDAANYRARLRETGTFNGKY